MYPTSRQITLEKGDIIRPHSTGSADVTTITGEIANHELLDVAAFGAALMSSSLYLSGGKPF